MEFYVGQIFINDYPSEAADFCNESGNYYIKELDREGDIRKFQIVENVYEESEEELAWKAKMEDEAKRLPELEDATIELAEYVAILEERITQLEAMLSGDQNG